MALRPRVQTPKSGPTRTVPLHKAVYENEVAKGREREKGNTWHRAKRPTLCELPAPPLLLRSVTQGHTALIPRAFLLNFI